MPPLTTVKFLAFGAEEGGLFGSRAYVSAHADELDEAVGMINLDMVGVGDYMSLGTIGVAGTELRDDAGQVATSLGYVWYPFVAEDDSDHAPFERAGVQALFLFQYDDPYYHSSNDTADRLDLEVMQRHGILAAEVLYRWASLAN
jgi:Zn-dependent M28 family amino/carboxypeptidase